MVENKKVISLSTYLLRNISMLFIGLLTLQIIDLAATELAGKNFYEFIPSSGLSLYAWNEKFPLISALFIGYLIMTAIIILFPRLKIYKYRTSIYTNMIVSVVGIALLALHKHYPEQKSAFIWCLIIGSAFIGFNLALCLYVGYDSILCFVVGYLLWDCCSGTIFIIAFDILREFGITCKTVDIVRYEIVTFVIMSLINIILWFAAYYDEYTDIIPIVYDIEYIHVSSSGTLENILSYERPFFRDIYETMAPIVLVMMAAFLYLVYPIIVPYGVLIDIDAITVNIFSMYITIVPAIVLLILSIFTNITPKSSWIDNKYWKYFIYLGLLFLIIISTIILLLYFSSCILFRPIFYNVFTVLVLTFVLVSIYSLLFTIGLGGSGYQIELDDTTTQYLIDDSRGKMTMIVMLFYLAALNTATVFSFIYIETYKVEMGLINENDPPSISSVITTTLTSYFKGKGVQAGYKLLVNKDFDE